MTLLVQRFLQDGGTLEQLGERYAIKHKRHPKYSSLVQLKYNQIDSPFREQIVCECRGLILSEAHNWWVVARPFDKFFNIEEGRGAQIDWPSARVQEKLDGSLIIMYWYDNKWQVATSGMPDAGGEVNGLGITFSRLFWHAFDGQSLKRPDEHERDYTFMFELCAPENRIVVQHTKPRVSLIGVRHKGGVECSVDMWTHRYPVVRQFDLIDVNAISKTFDDMDPLKQEGYVVVDKHFNRVKIKSPRYVAIHHAIDGMGPKRALEIIRNGESEEVLAKFPEWKDRIDDIRARYKSFMHDVEQQYILIRDIPIQRDFAKCALKSVCSDAMFKLRAGNVSTVKEYMKQYMRTDTLADMLNLGNGTFATGTT